MNWNNRVVHIKGDCFAMREVYYDDDGNLMGHATPCLVGDTVEELQHQISRWVTAAMQPVLDSDAFPNNEIVEDELVVGRIEIIENAIAKMARELRSIRHTVEDDISRTKFNAEQDKIINQTLADAGITTFEEYPDPTVTIEMKRSMAKELLKKNWPNWGDRPDGFDGPGGAE